MPRKDPGPSVKDDETYEALRRDGASKEKAARIANAKANKDMHPSKKGGKAPPYEEWTKDDLYERAGIRANAAGVRVFFVAGLVELDGGSLKGCAGHAPGKPACVIDSNIATMFTLSHELGHVLLTSSFSPVHHPSNNNIMFRVTDGHTLSRPPVFDAAQITQIRSNALLR